MKGYKENIVRPCAVRRSTSRALFPRCRLRVRSLKANRLVRQESVAAKEAVAASANNQANPINLPVRRVPCHLFN